MGTKTQLVNLLPAKSFDKFINNLNFEQLDKFVLMLVSGYVSRKGQNVMRQEIDSESSSDTNNFLTSIIEVGSLKVLSDNNLITNNRNENEGALITVAFAMNISMATALKVKEVYIGNPNYYDIPALKILFGRIAIHIDKMLEDKSYLKPLLNNYLLYKI